MSQNLQALLALANDAAETYVIDMSETSTGGGARRLFKPGYAFGRFCRYIEFGKQPQEYNGKPKDPALEFRLGFAIWGDANPSDPRPQAERPEDFYHNLDGSPSFMGTWDMALGNNEKAKAKISFDKMNYKGTAKHFAQMLGEGFLLKIDLIDVAAKPNKPAHQRNQLDLKGTLPPFDLISRAPYPIPVAPDDAYQLFLWNRPTIEGWDALKIEGTNDQGKSKNFLQDKILSAVDFIGSPLETLLRGSGAQLPSPEALAGTAPAVPVVPAVPQVPATVPELPVNQAVPQVPVVPQVPAVPVVPQVPVVPTVPVVPAVPVADVPFDGGTIPEVPTVPVA
jgi:hypothetical protein